MQYKEPLDVMERIMSSRFKYRALSTEDRLEVFRRAWNTELIDGYLSISKNIYRENLLVLKFKNGRTLSIKPDCISSMTKTQRFLFNSSIGYPRDQEISINNDIRPSIWKSACIAFLEDCRRVTDIDNHVITQADVDILDFINRTKIAIKGIVQARHMASILTDVQSNAYQRLFVMREPMIFDVNSNIIIVKRSNIKRYIINSGDFEYTNELNISEKLISLALCELGFNRIVMSLNSHGGRINHQCILDVIDASLILDNAGAVTDAAE